MNQNKQEQIPNEKIARIIASHINNIDLHTNTLQLDLVETEIEYRIKKELDKKDQLISQTRQEAVEDEQKRIIEEIKSVCKVHKYLPKEYENKVVGFIENLDKPQPTI